MEPTRTCPNETCPDVVRSGVPGRYRAMIEMCPKCGTALVETVPAEHEVEAPDEKVPVEFREFVAVARIADAGSIPLLRSLLESAGIPFFIRNDTDQHLFGWGAFGVGHNPIVGLPVVTVDPDRAEEARALIEESPQEIEPLEG